MLYTSFLGKIVDEVITKADNGLYYLEPMWKIILHDNELDIKNITDFEVGWSDVEDVLKLEVEKRNTINSLTPNVVKWFHDIVTASIEPAILEGETDLAEKVINSLKQEKENQTNDEEWNKFKET